MEHGEDIANLLAQHRRVYMHRVQPSVELVFREQPVVVYVEVFDDLRERGSMGRVTWQLRVSMCQLHCGFKLCIH